MGALPVAVVSICECVFNAAVSFHVLMEFWMDQSRRVLVREGFTLAVGALRAEICTVRDLCLLQTNTPITKLLLLGSWRHNGVLGYEVSPKKNPD